MPALLRRPLAIAAIAFVIGVLAGPCPLAAALGAFILATALSWLALRRRSPLALLAIPCCFFAAGAACRAFSALDLPTELPVQPGKEIVIQGTVAGAPEHGPEEDALSIDLEAFAEARTAELHRARGRLRLFLPAQAEVASDRRSCGEAGDRIRVLAKVFPIPRDPRALDPREAPIASASTNTALACVKLEEQTTIDPASIMERERSGIHRAIDRALTGDRAAIVRAFATGDRSGIPRVISDDFQGAGLSHLLAVSGLNLAIIAGMFVVLLAIIFRRVERLALGIGAARLAAIPAIPFVVAYTLLVGASASAVRSAIMVLALLVAQIIGRLREPITALSLALLLMLAIDPGALSDVSLELSFAAVLALFYLHPIFARRVHALPALARVPIEVAIASFVAALATAPIAARHFQQLSLIGIAANVPAHPLASFVLVPLALIGGVAGLASDTIARPILWVAGWGAEALLALAHSAARVPGGTIDLFAPNLLECALFVALLCAIVASRKRVAIACALLLAIELAAIELLKKTSEELRVTILSVGQGDSIVVELPHGKTIVVDTGPGSRGQKKPATERALIPFLASRRIHRIDRLIITHPHGDHAGGLAELMRRVPVDDAWWSGELREAPPEALQMLTVLRARSPPLGIETIEGVELEVLAGNEAAKKVNDGSIVVRLAYKDRAILLAGDAEKAEERAMVERCERCLRADVLKLGHHGSRTSTSEPFLDAVAPKIAVASLARGNHFGFPNREVVERLAARGIAFYRTDLDGAVTIETDGHALRVTPPSPLAPSQP